MENRVLRYFLTIVSEGNISAAANLLHITQPTLSRQIKDLENELGVTLFQRNGRYMSLTKEGHYLAEQARDIINLVDKTVSNIQISQDIYGEITIGMAESKVVTHVIKTMKDIRKNYKNVKFDTYSGNGEQILEKLDNGLLDFGIVVEPINKLNYESLPLAENDTWGVLSKIDSDFKDVSHVTADLLKNQPLIISKQDGVRTMIANMVNIDVVELNIVATYNLLYNASLMVKEGVGHAICLDGIINTDNTDLRFIPFSPQITSNLSIIWKKDKPLSQAAQLFLEQLKHNNF
ncbi:LysR family transcriptional regulator [Staphylococcus warneri]|uniref:LysR family transcriptional regulator n=1 Tax=Staphylococcus warneri TaxID=1292 RepID=UPI003F15773C